MLTGLKKKTKLFCKRHQTTSDDKLFNVDFASRCYVAMIVKIVTSTALAVLNHESFQQAKETMDDSEAEFNASYVRTSNNVLKYILIVLNVCRIPLFLFACKDKRVVKVFFFYETVIEMVGHFIP